MKDHKGRLILISAPSGAGKTTLVKRLLQREPRARFSISFTTRPPRATERDGVDYFFIDENRFNEMVAEDEFLEYAQVFDNWYGTGKTHVDQLVREGTLVVLEIDWQGAAQVRAKRPDATSVFVMPPSLSELERRLRGRASDSEDTIARRLQDARSDMAHWSDFDYVIVNDDLDRSADDLVAIVRGSPTPWASREDAALRRQVSAILVD